MYGILMMLFFAAEVQGNWKVVPCECGEVPGRGGKRAMGSLRCAALEDCVHGLNYARHAAETGKEVPKEPVIFMKAPSACAGRL